MKSMYDGHGFIIAIIVCVVTVLLTILTAQNTQLIEEIYINVTEKTLFGYPLANIVVIIFAIVAILLITIEISDIICLIKNNINKYIQKK